MNEEAEALAKVIDVLEGLGVPFFIGGSVASALFGTPRATMDIDIVANIPEPKIVSLREQLGPKFYVDEEEMRRAFRAGRSVNIIHIASAHKFDIFPAQRDRYHSEQMRRALASPVRLPFGMEAPAATAEDILLEKLRWYRLGGEVSDHQWNDVRGIRDVQGDRLDREYLARWAGDLGVEDLLQKLLTE